MSTDTNSAIWKSETTVQAMLDNLSDRERKRAPQLLLLAQLLPFAEDDAFTFLDIGAGLGVAARAVMTLYPRSRAVLADFSPQMMAEGTRLLEPFAGRFAYVEFDIAEGAWPAEIPDPLDAAISSLAVHHLPDARKRSLFREVREHLRPGGWLLNVDPVHPPDAVVGEAWERTGDKRDPDAAHQRTHRTAHEQAQWENHVRYMVPLDPLVGFLREAGFEGVDVYFKQLEVAIYGGRRPLA